MSSPFLTADRHVVHGHSPLGAPYSSASKDCRYRRRSGVVISGRPCGCQLMVGSRCPALRYGAQPSGSVCRCWLESDPANALEVDLWPSMNVATPDLESDGAGITGTLTIAVRRRRTQERPQLKSLTAAASSPSWNGIRSASESGGIPILEGPIRPAASGCLEEPERIVTPPRLTTPPTPTPPDLSGRQAQGRLESHDLGRGRPNRYR